MSIAPDPLREWCATYSPLQEWALGTRTAEDLEENECDDGLTPPDQGVTGQPATARDEALVMATPIASLSRL